MYMNTNILTHTHRYMYIYINILTCVYIYIYTQISVTASLGHFGGTHKSIALNENMYCNDNSPERGLIPSE